MKTFFKKLTLIVWIAIVSLSWVVFATQGGQWWWNTKTDFFNQNTKHIPGVPKAPNEETKDLSKEDATWWVNGLLGTVKNVINRVLGLLALIALIILIYQGLIMLINAKDSKKIEEWYTTVKNVAIALVFIWVSWLVVSFIFWAIGQFTNT